MGPFDAIFKRVISRYGQPESLCKWIPVLDPYPILAYAANTIAKSLGSTKNRNVMTNFERMLNLRPLLLFPYNWQRATKEHWHYSTISDPTEQIYTLKGDEDHKHWTIRKVRGPNRQPGVAGWHSDGCIRIYYYAAFSLQRKGVLTSNQHNIHQLQLQGHTQLSQIWGRKRSMTREASKTPWS